MCALVAGCRFDASGLIPGGRDRAVATDARRDVGSPDLPLQPDVVQPDRPRPDTPLPPDGRRDAPLKPDASLPPDGPRSDALVQRDQPVQRDAHVPDAPPTLDLPPKPDLPKPDLPKPDLPEPDLPKIDTKKPDMKPPKTCDDIYSTASGYILCQETATSCEFNANTPNGNCQTLCTSFSGQTCLGAHDNPDTAGQECNANLGAGDDCSTNRGTEICVCSRN